MAAKRKAGGNRNSSDTASMALTSEDSEGAVRFFELDQLRLDLNNPRFGNVDAGADEASVLEFIHGNFDIKDVLSSIAVNGYFRSEPLIGVTNNDGSITIVEGNRRLAACLILTGDPRAVSLKPITRRYQSIWKEAGKRQITPLPVSVYSRDNAEAFRSYLGVRHIQGSRAWDSYAKAAWIAEMVESSELNLSEIAAMIGDTQRLARRLLLGYYVVKQLESENLFFPESSQRKGRGSCIQYPFSWVYTILSTPKVREWIGVSDEPSKNPIPREHLANGELLLTAMFGQGTKPPAIQESRELSDLARALTSSDGPRLLRKGLSVQNMSEVTKPAKTRVEDGLTQAEQGLQACLPPINSGEVSEVDAEDLAGLSKRVASLARSVDASLRDTFSQRDERHT